MERVIIKTPLGNTLIEGDHLGVSSISTKDISEAVSTNIPSVLAEAVKQLQEYFEGNRKEFTFPLHIKGTEFQQKVWKSLLEIPFGKTTSYLEQSKKLGNTKAIRAVASANGKNPLSIVVPCHRVIGSNGSLTGFASGLWRKEWLLTHESPSPQQKLF